MASFRKHGKVWYYRYVNLHGRLVERAGCPDKTVTMRLSAEAESRVALERAGLADPFEIHRGRPIEDHVGEYIAFLESKGNTAKYVDLTATRLRAVVAGCGVARLGDLDAAKVSSWLSDRRAETMSAATSNYYLQAITGFARWLVKHGRMPANPLGPLSPMNTKTDRRHDRGTLSTDEFDALIRATMPAKPFRGLTGQDRTILYLVASYTGLRASELASLTPAGFRLDTPNPTVHVLATITKNRTAATLPVQADLAERLRAYLVGRRADLPVWPGTWVERSAKMLRNDLERAGVAYQDDEGLYRDFHSLRHRFGSELAKANVPPKVAQTLMRHSTITLTLDRYSHVGMTDTAGAVGKLPTLPQDRPIGESLPQHFPNAGDGSGRSVTDVGGMEGEVTLTPMIRKSKEDGVLDGAGRGMTVTDGNSGGGTRTPDLRGLADPLLCRLTAFLSTLATVSLRSASTTIITFFPPISAITYLTCSWPGGVSAACRLIRRPTSREPMNATTSTPGWLTRAWPTSGPVLGRTWSTLGRVRPPPGRAPVELVGQVDDQPGLTGSLEVDVGGILLVRPEESAR